jgi:hypothetical protein
VLASPGLRNHPFLSYPTRKQDLAQGVVDLVGAGMAEVLALEIDPGASQLLGKTPRKIERRFSSGIVPEVLAQLLLELLIFFSGEICRLQLEEGRHQGLGGVAPSIDAEMPFFIGLCLAHRFTLSAIRIFVFLLQK